MKNEPYEKNCAGDFIVEDGNCMLCCLPETEAPELMEHDDNSCYFKKQPQTTDEISHAIEAINVSCCEAVIYVGKDRGIIRKILAPSYSGLDTVPAADYKDIWFARLNRIFKGLSK